MVVVVSGGPARWAESPSVLEWTSVLTEPAPDSGVWVPG
jgi:hypothetical protein